jgi:hypothetical protein
MNCLRGANKTGEERLAKSVYDCYEQVREMKTQFSPPPFSTHTHTHTQVKSMVFVNPTEIIITIYIRVVTACTTCFGIHKFCIFTYTGYFMFYTVLRITSVYIPKAKLIGFSLGNEMHSFICGKGKVIPEFN